MFRFKNIETNTISFSLNGTSAQYSMWLRETKNTWRVQYFFYFSFKPKLIRGNAQKLDALKNSFDWNDFQINLYLRILFTLKNYWAKKTSQNRKKITFKLTKASHIGKQLGSSQLVFLFENQASYSILK